MALRNYQEYTVSQHAKELILTRFNITNQELDKWLTRLLSQCAFVEQENERQTKYRLHDIVIIADTKQQVIVTVYSLNEHDDNPVKSTPTNPAVQTALNDAMRKFISQRRVKTAIAISEEIATADRAIQRMLNPSTPHRYTDKAWEEFIENFEKIRSKVDSTQSVNQEAAKKME